MNISRAAFLKALRRCIAGRPRRCPCTSGYFRAAVGLDDTCRGRRGCSDGERRRGTVSAQLNTSFRGSFRRWRPCPVGARESPRVPDYKKRRAVLPDLPCAGGQPACRTARMPFNTKRWAISICSSSRSVRRTARERIYQAMLQPALEAV